MMLERLKNSAICSGLTHEEVRRVAGRVHERSCSSGTVICRQGEPGESMFIIAAGRVSATATAVLESESRFIGYRGPGDHFGEMALVGDGRRTATVESVADSELFELDRGAFHQLIGEVPRFAANLLATLSARLEEETRRVEPRRRVRSVALLNSSTTTQNLLVPLVVGLLEEQVKLQVFSDRASMKAIQENSRCSVFDVQDKALAEDAGASLRARLAEGLRDQRLSLVDLLAAETGDELPAFLSQCEEIWWLVDARESAGQDERLRALLERSPGIAQRLRWVWVLRQGDSYAPVLPGNPPFEGPSFKVCLGDNSATSARQPQRGVHGLVHHLLGKRIGIALSGGAARGLAHFGALRALESRGIHVDVMTGTSCGAFVAALHCAGWGPDEALDATTRELDPSNFLKRLPRGNEWYIMMMFRFGLWKRFLHTVLDDPLFEQLSIPLSTVAVDLVSGRRVVRETGNVVDSITESINLPILAPPITSNGTAIVDGGVLDNLPLDLLPERGADIVIGFDVTTVAGEFSNRATVRNGRPGMLESVARIYELQQREFANRHRSVADVIVDIDTSAFRFSDFTRGQEIAEVGEAATLRAIPEIERAIAGSQRVASE